MAFEMMDTTIQRQVRCIRDRMHFAHWTLFQPLIVHDVLKPSLQHRNP